MSRMITTHLTVRSPVHDVWEVLTDLAGYRTWNPFITAAAGTAGVGERLDLTIQPPGGRAMSFRPWVTAVEPHRYLEWLGHLGLPGVIDGRHSFTLTPMVGGRTLVQQSETFTGVLVPFGASILARTRGGFTAMNAALAEESARRGAAGSTGLVRAPREPGAATPGRAAALPPGPDDRPA